MSKSKTYSWKEIVFVAQKNDGKLNISWNYRNDQKRNAARKAVKEGFLKKQKGSPGSDHFVLALEKTDPKMIALSQGLYFKSCSPELMERIRSNIFQKMDGQEWQIADWINEKTPSIGLKPGESLEDWMGRQKKNQEAIPIIRSIDDQLMKM